MKISELLGQGYNEFWHSKDFYRVIKGSRASKKSKNTAIDLTLKIMRYSWSNVLVIRRYSNTNRQSTFTDFKWAINRVGVTHLFKFNESLPEIVYKPTGQKIMFRGLDDEMKITSISVDVGVLSFVWFEEAYQIETVDKFDTVIESIRGTHEDPEFYKQITITFNPWNEYHWLKREFFDEETKREQVYSNTTTFRINEWLDDSDIARYEDLYRTNPTRARVVGDGDWGVSEGLVFENFRVQELSNFEGENLYGMDFGFTNDPSTFIGVRINQESKQLYIFDEHYEQGMLTSELSKMVIDKGYEYEAITADGAEPRLVAELKRSGLPRIKSAKKGSGSIMRGIIYLQEYEIIIDPRCSRTIEEFNTYSYKRDNITGRWKNEPVDDHNHLIDALRYALEEVMNGNNRMRTLNKNALGL